MSRDREIPDGWPRALTWAAVVLVVGYFAYGVGHGIGGAREMEKWQQREKSYKAALEVPAPSGRPLPPFEGPPRDMPPQVDCFVEDGVACCFQRYTDATFGVTTYAPIGCVPNLAQEHRHARSR